MAQKKEDKTLKSPENPSKLKSSEIPKKEKKRPVIEAKDKSPTSKASGKSSSSMSKIEALDILIAKYPNNPSYKYDKILIKKKKDYDSNPTSIKKDEVALALNTLVNEHPSFEKAYWLLFDTLHHYVDWTQGSKLENEEDIFAVMDLLERIEEKFGTSPKLIKYSCIYLMKNNFHKEGRKMCLKLKKEDPLDPDGYLLADYLFSEETNKEKALLEILKNFPNSEKVLFHVAQMFYDKKAYSFSFKFLKKALKEDSKDLKILLLMAQTLFKMNQTDEALDFYFKACKSNKLQALKPFQKAKTYLNHQRLFKKAEKYQNKINNCINL